MSRNALPESGNWAAVERAIHRQMKKLNLSIARLSRGSGVSETTIRYIGQPEKRQRSTLVALAAALGFPHDYLVDVLRGTAGPDAPQSPASDAAFMTDLLAEFGQLIKKMDGLLESVHVADGNRRRQEKRHPRAGGESMPSAVTDDSRRAVTQPGGRAGTGG